MGIHRELFAVNVIFAWRMKMVLLQFIIVPIECDRTARLVIDLDGMPIVYVIATAGSVMKIDWWQLTVDHVGQIDWRLVFATPTDLEMGVEFTPVLRSLGAGIAPARAVIRQRETAAGHQSQCHEQGSVRVFSRHLDLNAVRIVASVLAALTGVAGQLHDDNACHAGNGLMMLEAGGTDAKDGCQFVVEDYNTCVFLVLPSIRDPH
jgi:hypothetical protein